jgi:hypothetical protein
LLLGGAAVVDVVEVDDVDDVVVEPFGFVVVVVGAAVVVVVDELDDVVVTPPATVKSARPSARAPVPSSHIAVIA